MTTETKPIHPLDAPVEPLLPDHIDPTDVRCLFQAVIVQAFRDACWNRDEVEGMPPLGQQHDVFNLAIHERGVARAWLRGTAPDFPIICALAGFDPAYLVRKAADMAKRGWPNLAELLDEFKASFENPEFFKRSETTRSLRLRGNGKAKI